MDTGQLKIEANGSPSVFSFDHETDPETSLAPSAVSVTNRKLTSTSGSEYLELIPNVRVELLSEAGLFRGLGAIEIDGVAVRSSHRPMFAEIHTPDGVEFFDFELQRRSELPDGYLLEFSMKARASGMQEWMVHTIRNLRVTRDWAQKEWRPEARLKLKLRGVEKIFDSRPFRGFEYQYEFESREHPIYRLLDVSSWAIGNTLSGNTFWLRNCFSPSLHTFQGEDDFYSTEWFLGSINNPNIFQFQPFQTNMESFTMMSAPQGQLLTIAPQLFHLRSFFEKPRDTEELLHWHEHCGDLTSHFQGAPIEVLFCSQAATFADLINLNEAVRDEVSNDLHHQAGLRRERITTYGVIEEWGAPNLKDYTERALPQLLDLELRCIFLPNQFKHNMNMWGVSNMCCTVDYRMPSAEKEAQLRAFCQRAHEGGAAVQMWGNTALSSLNQLLAPQDKTFAAQATFLDTESSVLAMLKRASQPFIRNSSGAVEADHYSPAFLCLNLREPVVRDYWHQCWREAREQIGLDGIFLDSSFNLTSDKFHYSYQDTAKRSGATADQTDLIGQTRSGQRATNAILSMYFAHLEWIAEMQKYGYHYSGEDVGVFGLRRSGPGIERRLDSLFLWSDCYAVLDRAAIQKAVREPDDVFFRGLAYRLMWTVYWNFTRQTVSFRMHGGSIEDDPTTWHRDILRAFNRAEARMHHRHVLENERGVLYRNQDGDLLWAFTDFDFDLPPGSIARDLVTSETIPGTTLHAKKHGIYEIIPEAGLSSSPG